MSALCHLTIELEHTCDGPTAIHEGREDTMHEGHYLAGGVVG